MTNTVLNGICTMIDKSDSGDEVVDAINASIERFDTQGKEAARLARYEKIVSEKPKSNGSLYDVLVDRQEDKELMRSVSEWTHEILYSCPQCKSFIGLVAMASITKLKDTVDLYL